jgi:hypothetical protein
MVSMGIPERCQPDFKERLELKVDLAYDRQGEKGPKLRIELRPTLWNRGAINRGVVMIT